MEEYSLLIKTHRILMLDLIILVKLPHFIYEETDVQ